jgi:hypothetical protein
MALHNNNKSKWLVDNTITQACLEGGRLTPGGEWAGDDELGPCIAAATQDSTELGCIALQAAVTVLDEQGLPKVPTNGTFMAMFNNDLVPEETFDLWRRQEDPLSKRAQVVLDPFFNWLQAEEDDDDDGDD